MSSKSKFLGHPVHQMLIVFPLGLFLMAVIFDILYAISQNLTFAQVAFYDMAGGIIGGAFAAVFGFLDFLEIPEHTRARRIGRLHGIGNAIVIALFAVSWWLRSEDP